MGLSIATDVPLAPMTTLGVGGPARHFATASTVDEVLEGLAFAEARGLAALVIGGGSNLLVADRGFDGLVLRVGIDDLVVGDGDADEQPIDAGAGHDWDALVERSVHEGWAGLECLAGIPGRVGATPIQNVGAYGQEVSQTIRSVRVVDRRTRQISDLSPAECGFGYRDSVFKGAARDRYVVLRVIFSLRPGGAPSLAYPELQRALAVSGGTAPSLREVRAAVLALRRKKSMVLDPDDPNRRSAGSFFTNPVVLPGVADRVADLARARGTLAEGEAMPRFEAREGRVKLSAGWLIERSGLSKGEGEGPVGLSTRHALAVVNRGGATATEIAAFASSVRRRVYEALEVRLDPEPEWVGFTDEERAGYLGAL